ncbi:hypothetical protein A6U85_27440 [Agrobacterium sp. 13-626]|nr:hypothetical protein A6U85_27440 [Agrobacterium sp. 13-626]
MDVVNSRRTAIELRHFRYFTVLAEELHFSRAADRLHIVQPALTAQIKALEEILGAQLLARTKRRVELTEAGRQFLKESYLTLSQVDTAVRTTRDVARGAVGRLRIGYGANAAVAGVMQSSIRRFQAIWPDVAISLEEMASSEVIAALRLDELDVGYAAATKVIEYNDIAVKRIGTWPWLLAVSGDHRFTSLQSVSVEDISAESLAVYAEAGAHLDISSVMAVVPDLVSEHVHQSSHIMSLMTYVASGLAVAFVPEPIGRLAFPGIKFVKVAGAIPPMEMNLIWPAAVRSPIVANFLASLDE